MPKPDHPKREPEKQPPPAKPYTPPPSPKGLFYYARIAGYPDMTKEKDDE